MMRVLIKGINEGNVDKVFECFTNLALSPAPLYKSLSEGLDQVIIECKEDQFLKLKNDLNGVCEVILMESKESPPLPVLSLVSLFLDNLLLFYILKLSIYSSDFRIMLGYLFSSSKAQAYFQLILSLLLIVGYYYAFITTKEAPPIARLLEIRYPKDKNWIILAYSLPLIGLYLISSGIPFGRLLGLAMLSFSVGILVYSNVKFS
ncbi:MAG: hypothetical protein OWQ49_03065 [Aquificaceae bacterium]|nr:hypothetical protein [Aquificaceae bacterium]